MSSTKCCVPGCSNSQGSSEVLHKFPNPAKNKDLFNAWLHAVGGDILGLGNDHIFKYRRVCRRHFDEKYWCRNNRLSNIAVPTNLMPGLSVPKVTYAERRPLRSIQNLREGVPSTSNDPMTLYSVAPEYPDKNTEADKPEMILGLSVPEVTYAEKRPLGSIQNLREGVPSTSNDPMTLYSVAPEYPEKNTEADKPEMFLEPRQQPQTLDSVVTQEVETEIPSLDSIVQKSLIQLTDKDILYKNNSGCVSHTGVSKTVKRRKLRTFMSKTEEDMHRKLIQVGIKLSKCRSRVKKQALKIKAMQDMMSHPEFLKILGNMSSTAKLLILLQFREHKKGMKGRRFTIEEKLKALSIFKQSPKGYRFFRKIFILPSPQTLVKLLSMADIRPGINKKILSQIKKATAKMNAEEKLCILLFDEMALKPNVAYNERKDKVIGFICNGENTKPEFADHAQVYMIRGLMKNYKQPVAYTFSQAATKGPELVKQLKEVISQLQDAGLVVVATVCDQGTNNTQAIKLLVQENEANLLRKGEELRQNTFFINDQEIIPLFDPPHLIKCVRNNLLTKNLNYLKNQKLCTAKWSHVTDLHKENPGYKGIRLVPKLTDYHCVPSKIPKQKVKYATQVLSQTVGTNMGYLADKGILSPECKETADILIFFDKLFDSVNGSYSKRKKFGKPLLGPVTPASSHHQVWEEAKKMLKSMNFVKPNSTKVEYVPTLKNWVWTLEGIEYLLKQLKSKYQISSVWLRHLNQDPIENFFGSIRSHGCRDINPSAEKFESAYSTLLINSLSSAHAPGANCEMDDCVALSDIIITGNDCKVSSTCEFENVPDITITPLEEKAADPRKIGGLQYVSGFFLKNAKKHVFRGCEQCKIDLINDNEPEYIKYRQYTNKKWLCSPTDSLLWCISNLQDINYAIIKSNLQKNNLKEFIKTIVFMFVEFDFMKCRIHKEENISYLLKISCRFFIFNYCKEINSILKNKRECDDDEELFKLKARKHFVKCLKRKK